MAINLPYVTDKFIAYEGDVITTRLSLAVWLIDEFTKKEPIGNIKVMIKGGDIEPVKNLSGYYCFTDLAAGNYIIGVESDWYFPIEKTVDTSVLNPKNPVVEIEIKPKPSYPFPSHATLVRGIVMGPIVNAGIEVIGNTIKIKKVIKNEGEETVEVIGKTIKTITDERGEFVLCFKGIKKENITIQLRKGTDTKKASKGIIEEGKTVWLGIINFS